MDKDLLQYWLETSAELGFSRSSGPGGQNVNKSSTKVLIRIPLGQEIPGLSESERLRLQQSLASRLTNEKDLVLQVQDQRSQIMNRALAVERALALITLGLHRDKPRRKTKPTRASQERRLGAKKKNAALKSQRSRPDAD